MTIFSKKREPEMFPAVPVHPEALHLPASWNVKGWQWELPRHGEPFRRCSYCGSVDPLYLVGVQNARIEWSDRKYGWPHKVYVDIPNPNPEALYCVGAASWECKNHGYVTTKNLTREQKKIIKRDGMTLAPGRSYLFGTRSHLHGKFYSVHLSDPNLDPHIRDRIERMLGMKFTFGEDDSIRWQTIPKDK